LSKEYATGGAELSSHKWEQGTDNAQVECVGAIRKMLRSHSGKMSNPQVSIPMILQSSAPLFRPTGAPTPKPLHRRRSLRWNTYFMP